MHANIVVLGFDAASKQERPELKSGFAHARADSGAFKLIGDLADQRVAEVTLLLLRVPVWNGTIVTVSRRSEISGA